jgi:hypothetical protein
MNDTNSSKYEKHELEPWVLGGISGRTVTTPSGYYGDGIIADCDTKANGNRIVECVNACAGLDDPQELRQQIIEALKPFAATCVALEARHQGELDDECLLSRVIEGTTIADELMGDYRRLNEVLKALEDK